MKFFVQKVAGAMLSTILFTLPCAASAATLEGRTTATSPNALKAKLELSIQRGVEWLKQNQKPSGAWSNEDYPAITALALVAAEGNPIRTKAKGKEEWLQRGYDFVLSCAQPDGSIHRTNLLTYNTSICLLALQASNNPEYLDEIRRGREFLISLQRDFGKKGELDSPFDGGIGYGSKYEHSDMGNTLQALEALYHTRDKAGDKGGQPANELNFEAALHFLQRCQNLPSHNPEKWASDDPQNKGGFIYYPGHSMAGTTTNSTTGRVALRSYGSISYGGMLSFIYAGLKPEDARVQAVLEWLKNNYTLEENPGMGLQGLYYYYHTMAKALNIVGIEDLKLPNGTTVNWRSDLAERVLKLQSPDGSWANDNARWFEKDPVLVTAYCLMTLEIIHGKL